MAEVEMEEVAIRLTDELKPKENKENNSGTSNNKQT